MSRVIKVLFVDDDTNSRSLYAEALRAANFDVTEAGDGLSGLEMASKSKPDIIVSGIIMPRMDGFQLVEALKKNVMTSQVPVIFLSHLGREEDEQRAKEFGVSNFLLQDITTPRNMIDQINACLMSAKYVLGIDVFSFDAGKFAKDFHLNSDFVCPQEKEGGRVTLTLRRSERGDKHFDAEITCT
ncbi:MAG: response regulator [Candidatus Moraniibacteriota bacterium]